MRDRCMQGACERAKDKAARACIRVRCKTGVHVRVE